MSSSSTSSDAESSDASATPQPKIASPVEEIPQNDAPEVAATRSSSSSENEGEETTDKPEEMAQESIESGVAGSPQSNASSPRPAAVSDLQKSTEKDLFGDADDLSSSDGEHKEEREREMGPDDIVGPRLYPEEEEGEPTVPHESVIDVEAPRICVDLGRSGAYFVKFPNFLSVEPRPFDPNVYEDEIDEDEVLDEEGRSRLKLKVENTVRWRQTTDEDGNMKQESNAKIVRWSDGTMSLYLGSEIFDIHLQPVQDHNHLFVRQGAGLQGQNLFRTKLTFRPHSTDTMTHRKMTLSMADRSNKAQKVKVLPAVGKNPEAEKQELVRREEERLRATIRRESQQRRARERSSHAGLSAGFLEPDRDYDSDEGESLSAIKRSYKPGGKAFDRWARTSDSDSDLDDKKADKQRISDSDDDFSGAEDKKKAKKKIVIDEDSGSD